MQAFVIAVVICLCGLPLRGQFLLLDRELKQPAEAGRMEAKGPGFLADRFSIGSKGDVWIIDRLRMWGHFDTGRIEKVTLFGGLEAKPPAPGEFECDCHNLIAINGAPRTSRITPSAWQLDFEHLNWSVPGGVEIQFGLSAARWSTYTVRAGPPHEVKLFDAKGKLVGPYGADPVVGFAVQVWGHLPVPVEIRPNGELWQVRLRSAGSFEVGSADRASLRFGPKGAAPTAVDRQGADMLLTFRAADTGLQPGDVNACLTGRKQDGMPFEGCDLLKKNR